MVTVHEKQRGGVRNNPEVAELDTACAAFPGKDEGSLAVSEQLSKRVLALPMHPYLDEPTQDRIVEAVRRALTN